MADKGRGSNLTDEERAKAGQHSQSGSSQDDTTSGAKGGQTGQGDKKDSGEQPEADSESFNIE